MYKFQFQVFETWPEGMTPVKIFKTIKLPLASTSEIGYLVGIQNAAGKVALIIATSKLVRQKVPQMLINFHCSNIWGTKYEASFHCDTIDF